MRSLKSKDKYFANGLFEMVWMKIKKIINIEFGLMNMNHSSEVSRLADFSS